MNISLDSIIERYFNERYKLYKPNDANGRAINQLFLFDSRADFLNAYIDFYRNLEDLSQAIKYGCSAKFKVLYNDEVYELKHNHQEQFVDDEGNMRGVENTILNNMTTKLLAKEEELRTLETFEEIYNIIKSLRVSGFGELSVYDTAVRISSFLGVMPDKVYLHAGAREGAKYLEAKGFLPDDVSMENTIPVDDFPDSFKDLNVLQIENLLCAFKGELEKI